MLGHYRGWKLEALAGDALRGSGRGWVYSVVRNLALNAVRDAAREVPVTPVILPSVSSTPEPDWTTNTSLQAPWACGWSGAFSRMKAVEKVLAQAREGIQNMNRKEYQLNLLEREVASNRQLYDMFMNRFKETNVAGDGAAYDPVADTWTPISSVSSTSRSRTWALPPVMTTPAAS